MIPPGRQPGERPVATPVWLRRLAELVILALVVVLHLVLLRHAGPAAVDEPNWLTSGYLTYQLYASGAPPERWRMAYDEAGLGDWGNLNPPLGKLWIGLFVAPAVPPGEPVLYRWQWPLGYRENLARGNLPPRRLLEPARRAIAATSIVLLIAVALLARALGSAWWAALFVPLVLLSVPSYEAHATHVYVDLPQLALAGMGLGALLRGTRRHGFGWIALGALLLGASCAVKLSSGVFVAGGVAALLIRPGWSWRRRTTSAALLGALAVALFIGVNPYLHEDPVGRLRGIVAGWQARKLQQAGDPLLARGRVSGPLEGLRLVTQHAVLFPGLSDLAGQGPGRRFHGAASALLLVTLVAGRESWRRARTGAPFSPPTERTAIIGTFGALLVAWALEAAPPSSVGAFAVPVVVGLAALAVGTHDAACRSWLTIWATSLVITGLWFPFDWQVYTLPVRLATIPIWSLGLTALARLSLRAAPQERAGAETPADDRAWSAVLASLVVILQLVEAASKI